jgi:lipopolysaccharide transport system permease protein
VVDFVIGFVMLLLLMWYYNVPLTLNLLWLPAFFLIALAAAFAVGFWFSALNVKYRDVKYIVPFITRIGLYASSVAYSTQWLARKVSEEWLFVYCLNPMVGVIDGFRWCIFGARFEPYWPGFWASLGIVVLMLVSGAYYFRRTEKSFADII